MYFIIANLILYLCLIKNIFASFYVCVVLYNQYDGNFSII